MNLTVFDAIWNYHTQKYFSLDAAYDSPAVVEICRTFSVALTAPLLRISHRSKPVFSETVQKIVATKEEHVNHAHSHHQYDINVTDLASTTRLSSLPLDSRHDNKDNETRYSYYNLAHPDLSEEAVQTLLEMPQIVLPILNFYRSALDYEKRLSDYLSEEKECEKQYQTLKTSGITNLLTGAKLHGRKSGTSQIFHLSQSLSDSDKIPWYKVQVVPIRGALSAFSNQKAATLGKLVYLQGTVMRLSIPKVICLKMVYQCDLCGTKIQMPVFENANRALGATVATGIITTLPVGGGWRPGQLGRCAGVKENGRKCNSKQYTTVTEEAICDEIQTFRIQASSFSHRQQKLQNSGGRSMCYTPVDDSGQYMDVEIRGPMVDQVMPGDVVTVGGIVCARRNASKQTGGSHVLYLKAVSVISRSRPTMISQDLLEEGRQKEIFPGSAPGMSAADNGAANACAVGEYYEYAQSSHWFEQLVLSFCPSIYGNEDLKAVLVLSLVGGSHHGPTTRASIHVLIIGNPGMGKSQLLRALCQLSYRSAYVCAHTSSTCGLTITLRRDASTGETTFEAGAVMHGDGGVTCIDEIDKGLNEHKTMLEVMEQQTISVAKAGMIFSIPVRTTIIAAGNPVSGHVNQLKTLAENINMSPALLSRFDVVYIMKEPVAGSGVLMGQRTNKRKEQGDDEKCNRERNYSDGGQDRNSLIKSLTLHILDVHRIKKGTFNQQDGKDNQEFSSGHINSNNMDMNKNNGIALLDSNFVRRFLAFAKHERNPTLSNEAIQVLKTAYLQQRQAAREMMATAGISSSTCPITPRRLQAMIRMAEAYAKVHLRTKVTAEDASFVIQLLWASQTLSLEEVQSFHHKNNRGDNFFPTPLQVGVKVSKAVKRKLNQRDSVIAGLKELADKKKVVGGVMTMSEILEVCESAGCRNPTTTFNHLSEGSILLQVSGGKYTLRRNVV